MSEADRKPGEDAVLARLVRTLLPGAEEEHPSADELSALCEGRLDAEVRERLERHLASCDECRGVWTALARPPASGGTPPWLWATLAAAAALVLVVLLERQGTAQDAQAQLARLARELAARHPALLEGFEPLGPEEAPQPLQEVLRGGVRLLQPAPPPGRTLAVRPTFTWTSLPGASRYTVELGTASGEPVFTRTVDATRLEFPPEAADLVRGRRYLWSVRPEHAAGGETSRVFDVAGRGEAERLARAAAATRAIDDGPLGDLLLAQIALRADLLDEARRRASALAADPEVGAVARATLRFVRARLGEPEPTSARGE